jgi:diguanylate cyclase (GGDEF)-like protein
MQADIKKFEFDKSRVRVLVVDDEPSIREMISIALKDDGWFVETAENGKVAFEKLAASPFHVVMTDINMPEMSGIELLQAVKKRSPHTEVLIMTSNASLETAVQAIKSGAYDYLNKPFDDIAIVPKKMTQVAEKILLRQQNAELMKRLKGATLNLKLLFEATRELNGILDLEALRSCVLSELPKLQQKPNTQAAWYERLESGWKRVAATSDSSNLPELVEGDDLEVAFPAQADAAWKVVRLEYEGACSDALVFDSVSDGLPDLLMQEVRTTYEKVRMHARWVSLANRDGLTMLYNHRYFQERLRQELSQAKRQEGSLSVVLLDVDHFKKYNDQNGHPAGDELLRQLSHLLANEIGNRESDILARYGGEEFILMLPFTPLDGALIKAKRIQEAVAAHSFLHAEKQPLGCVSVSVGVASYPSNALEAAELIEKADQALYAAKSAGRNRVVSYDSISVSQPNSLVVEPVIEAVPKTTLADVVDFGEDLPDPSQLIAQVEVKALGEDDSALKALMQSIDSAYETAKKEEIAQAEISVAGGGMKNESGA